MKKVFTALTIAAIAGPVLAQMTPVGTWHSVDDKTGEAKAEIVITQGPAGLSGRIDQLLREGAKTVCEACTDDRKNQPMLGLEIIRGGQQSPDQEVWEGGHILDPENGKEYRASLTPIEGGSKLQVRGYLGPFWRTQTWVRVH